MVATIESCENKESLVDKVLAPGKYTIVGIDIDTTGRRLIDEIVQLAAYTPKNHFEQYIMPYMNLNPAARQRHQVRVISIGFYRMLKSMQTYKIIKSKSEIAAIKDFLDWIEVTKANDEGSEGIILVCHEERKFIPYVILESLKKYNLLDRFLNSVKAFVNGMHIAKSTNESFQHFSLRKLSKVLNTKLHCDANNSSEGEITSTTSPQKTDTGRHERELFDGNASVRAKLAYEVTMYLCNFDNKEVSNPGVVHEKFMNGVLKSARPIQYEIEELKIQNLNLERQNSFRPLFLNYFKTTLYHRVRAVKFRIILAENGHNLQSLNKVWNETKKNGLITALQVIEELKTEDKLELADLLDSYFDPNKTTIKPAVKNYNRRRNRRGLPRNSLNNDTNNIRAGIEQGAGGDKQVTQIPDTTAKELPNSGSAGSGATSVGVVKSGPAGGGAKQQRAKRNGRLRNKPQTATQNPSQPQQTSVPITVAPPVVAAN